jgi:trk system potassium uptake protein TrkH
MVVGGVLLLMPFANTTGTFTPPLVAFFTAISAVSTTGLTLEVTATYWSAFGQAVIFVLMFVGGLGFMTTATFFMIAIGIRITLPHRLLMQESLLTNEMGNLGKLTRNVFLIGLLVCLIGTILLFWPFLHYFGAAEALWQATFHSVSAFNTAGFDIVGPTGLAEYQTDLLMLGVLTVIFITGALSYPVLIDLFYTRRFRLLALNTKLVILGSLAIWIPGSLTVFASEYGNSGTLGALPLDAKIYNAVFNALSGSTTTGFSTIDFSQMLQRTNLFIYPIMFIGGASASTAGGIKINTFLVVLIVVYSWARERSHTEAFEREIDSHQVVNSVTIIMLGVGLLFLSTLILTFTDSAIPFLKLLFENISAFCTVGLSTGILPDLSVEGKLVIMFMMFAGRLGSLTLVMSLLPSTTPRAYRYPEERVVIG